MAEIQVDNGQVSIHLSLAEKVGELHGDLHFPRSAVRSVRIVDKPFSEIEGIRSPGTGVPGVIALGTYRLRGRRDFVAVYRGERGLVVEVDPDKTNYQRSSFRLKIPTVSVIYSARPHDRRGGRSRRMPGNLKARCQSKQVQPTCILLANSSPVDGESTVCNL